MSKTKGTPDEIDKAVGKRMRDFRLAKGISQEQVAEVCGVTFQQVQKYEKGVNRISASRLLTLSILFKVDMNEFYVDQTQKNPEPWLTKVQIDILRYFKDADESNLKQIRCYAKALLK